MKRLLTYFGGMILSLSLTAQSSFLKNNPVLDQLPDELSWDDKRQEPEHFSAWSLDFNQFRNQVFTTCVAKDQGMIISLPDPQGQLHDFVIQYHPVAEQGLLDKFPKIRTFRGYSLENKENVIRLTMTPHGLRGITQMNSKICLITPARTDGNNHHISFYQEDLPEPTEGEEFTCDVGHHFSPEQEVERIKEQFESTQKSSGEEFSLLRYRLAMACTGEFANKYGGTVQSAMAEMMDIVNKVNFAMHRDLGIELVLVANNDELVFLNANTDPYTNGATGPMLGENPPVLNQVIGLNNYDIGHVVGTNAGGLASLGVVCRDNKAAGVSCQFGNYFDEEFYIIVAHEMGHQFTARHTFNNCEGNESSGTAFEPGSGNTIMSYSGAGCSLWNQNVNDPYYHVNSIQSISNYARESFGYTCPEEIETENLTPDIVLPFQNGFYIPRNTPFELIGEAIDENGDDLTYTWEQYDLGPQIPTGQTPFGTAPFFKYNPPTNEPIRIFPRIDRILRNDYDNRLDFLPDTSREMNFRFVVRDNNDEAGATVWEQISFNVSNDGPFEIVYPNDGEDLFAGALNFIEWDPAGTTTAPVNCQLVDVFLSRDGGFTYPDTLATNLSNDGRALVFIPEELEGESTVRLKVKSSENIFFDLSDRISIVSTPSEPGFAAVVEPGYQEICLPEVANLEILTESYLGYDSALNIEYTLSFTDGVDFQLDQQSIIPGETINFSVGFDNNPPEEFLTIDFLLYNSTDTLEYTSTIRATSNDFSDLALIGPNDGVAGIELLPDFEWNPTKNADSYKFQIATNASFLEDFLVYEEITSENFLDGPFTLDANTIYFWRVIPINRCGEGEVREVRAFISESLDCSTYSYTGSDVIISSNSAGTTSIELVVVENGNISDINIQSIKGFHNALGQISGKIIGPDGTEAALWANECANRTTIDATFDDDASSDFDCLIFTTGGGSMRPIDALSIFNGKEQFGTWSLEVEDNAVGSGGVLRDFQLEICAAFSAVSPSKSKNDTLFMEPNATELITADLLEYSSNNIDPVNIIFQLTKATRNGVLRSKGRELQAGQGFRMTDILNGDVEYDHLSDQNEYDDFEFVVYSTNGGWAGPIDKFNIKIGDPISSTNEIQHAQELAIYPNPNGLRMARIHMPDELGTEYRISMFNLTGVQVPLQYSSSGQHIILNWNGLKNGLYLIEISHENGLYHSKLMITE
jgi:subtilisin-like proprotein convertase family protein